VQGRCVRAVVMGTAPHHEYNIPRKGEIYKKKKNSILKLPTKE
jgi:hypothetical protein